MGSHGRPRGPRPCTRGCLRRNELGPSTAQAGSFTLRWMFQLGMGKYSKPAGVELRVTGVSTVGCCEQNQLANLKISNNYYATYMEYIENWVTRTNIYTQVFVAQLIRLGSSMALASSSALCWIHWKREIGSRLALNFSWLQYAWTVGCCKQIYNKLVMRILEYYYAKYCMWKISRLKWLKW